MPSKVFSSRKKRGQALNVCPKNDEYASVRIAAIEKLEHQETLAWIAKNEEIADSVRDNAKRKFRKLKKKNSGP